MRSPMLLLALLLLSAGSLARGAADGAAEAPAPARFPRFVTTTQGEQIDLLPLAQRQSVVVVTLKATWCPVCRRQLERLEARMPDLRACGVRFLVLAPGPRKALESVRRETGFPAPFVEDAELAIARSLGLRLGPEEITPAIFLLESDLRIAWMQQGRNARRFGDGELLRELRCDGWI